MVSAKVSAVKLVDAVCAKAGPPRMSGTAAAGRRAGERRRLGIVDAVAGVGNGPARQRLAWRKRLRRLSFETLQFRRRVRNAGGTGPRFAHDLGPRGNRGGTRQEHERRGNHPDRTHLHRIAPLAQPAVLQLYFGRPARASRASPSAPHPSDPDCASQLPETRMVGLHATAWREIAASRTRGVGRVSRSSSTFDECHAEDCGLRGGYKGVPIQRPTRNDRFTCRFYRFPRSWATCHWNIPAWLGAATPRYRSTRSKP